MFKTKLAINVFSSGMQAIAVQVLGGAFFYLISVYVSKDNFGIISWANALSMFLITMIGFGLEQVVIRRVAASRMSEWAASAFFFHSLAGFLVTFLLLLLLSRFIIHQTLAITLLPWFFLAQGLIFVGAPLKQFLNAKEQFTPYGIIALMSNAGKIVLAIVLFKIHLLTIHAIIIILMVTGGFELLCLIGYVLTKTSFIFKYRFKAYVKLLRESSAQYLAVIFDMSLSRMDWILLGMMSTNAILADYSFAYRSFELARLPMVIIASILLPRFARLMATNNILNTGYQQQINSFNNIEIFFAVLIPLALNILWTPLITLITNGKYGETNALQFLILSLCIPLQFFMNLLWSLSFSAKKYKSVSTITIISAVANVLLNLVLISKFNGLGASIAFLLSTLLQVYLYHQLVRRQIMPISLLPILIFSGAAIAIYLMVINLPVHFLIKTLIAVLGYLLLGIASKLVSKQHVYNIRQFLSR